MCDVDGCETKPIGEEITTFGTDTLKAKLCQDHILSYQEAENHSHHHKWVSYASIGGCVCAVMVCGSAANLL